MLLLYVTSLSGTQHVAKYLLLTTTTQHVVHRMNTCVTLQISNINYINGCSIVIGCTLKTILWNNEVTVIGLFTDNKRKCIYQNAYSLLATNNTSFVLLFCITLECKMSYYLQIIVINRQRIISFICSSPNLVQCQFLIT